MVETGPVNYHLACRAFIARTRNGDGKMHTMTMIKEHEGTEEWLCSACGRHLLVSWNPKFKKIVLLEGDPSAKHTGLKNNLLVGQTVMSEAAEESMEEARLEPWMMWMDEVGFENLWNRDVR
jgi:hypothetical protein